MVTCLNCLSLLRRAKRQYPPLSLKTLQLLIDTERIDPSQPIDLAALCNSKALPFNPNLQQFGFNLTAEVSIAALFFSY